MKSKGSFRRAFITEFVKQLIVHHQLLRATDPTWVPEEQRTIQVPLPTMPPAEMSLPASEILPEKTAPEQEEAHDIRSIEMEEPAKPIEEPVRPQEKNAEYETSDEIREEQKKENFPQKEPPPLPEPPTEVVPLQEPSRLGKLEPLFADSEIRSIECSGPEQQITYTKNKQIQVAPFTLSQDELKNIIEGLSENLQTPLENQILSVENQQFIITGILSDYAGNRLAIHKK